MCKSLVGEGAAATRDKYTEIREKKLKGNMKQGKLKVR